MSRRATLVLGSGVVVFALVTTAVGAMSGAPIDFLVNDLFLGSMFVVGGFAAARLRPDAPTGPLLLLSAALWFLGSYAPTGQPVVTYIGFAFERYYDLALGALLMVLSAPGRDRLRRPLIVAVAVALAIRSFGRLTLQDPIAFGLNCPGCPPNPFALWPDLVAFEWVETWSNVALAVLLALVGLVALRRLVIAEPAARRIRWPILVAGMVAMGAGALDAFEYAWSTATGELLFELEEPWAALYEWTLFGARAVVPVGFVLGTLRLRNTAGALGPLAAELDRAGETDAVAGALRTALGDPTLQLLRPGAGAAWVEESGQLVDAPADGDRRAVTTIGNPEAPLAAVVHDPALREHPELLASVVAMLRLTLENERLGAELRRQLSAVTESRARIVTAATDERRRIERDLHDGAQQHLVAALLALQKVKTAAADTADPIALRQQIDAAVEEVARANRELRELARGIHPAILEEEGLPSAVAALGRRANLPVEVQVSLEQRLPAVVEATAYFTIAEALTNTQRYASATAATVTVDRTNGELRVDVIDDGVGGADAARGTGLRGLADRIGTLGGSLEIISRPGGGTRLRARIPIDG